MRGNQVQPAMERAIFYAKEAAMNANLNQALYQAACEADAHYSEVVYRLTKKTRWTMTADDEAIPEIAAAFEAKVQADEAWLAEMRRIGVLPKDSWEENCPRNLTNGPCPCPDCN